MMLNSSSELQLQARADAQTCTVLLPSPIHTRELHRFTLAHNLEQKDSMEALHSEVHWADSYVGLSRMGCPSSNSNKIKETSLRVI